MDFVEIELYGQKIKIERRNGKFVKPDILKQQEGFGSALKPAREDWILVYKPREGTYVENALKWGVAGLNIDGGRVPIEDGESVTINRWDDGAKPFGGGAGHPYSGNREVNGRWPANITHDGSQDVVGNFPNTGVSSGGRIGKKEVSEVNIAPAGQWRAGDPGFGDSGSAARFFYCAKPSRSERNEGLEDFDERIGGGMKDTQSQTLKTGSGNTRNNKYRNNHPTVKSLELMRYLVGLTKTPDGGKVLDPFMGTGSTGIACILEERDFTGIEITNTEKDPYFDIAKARLEHWINKPKQLGFL